jgi:hypothetical protein
VTHPFRQFIPAPDHPKVAGLAEVSAEAYGRRVLQIPFIRDWTEHWRRLYEAPFVGITTDGRARPGLFERRSNGAPAREMVAAAHRLIGAADPAARGRLLYPLDAPEWRLWSNPEFYINPVGIRLEEAPDLREPVHALLRASLSGKGFDKIAKVRRINAFLGELCNARRIMNEDSYNFSLFGTPELDGAWGWQLFGHHLVLNCLVLRDQMVLSPCFLGAEPNIIDTGPHAGTTLFEDEERLGLQLMRSLSPDLRDRAIIYRDMTDPSMPPGRYHRADQRQLGGAFQDNRIVPYEGVPGAAMPLVDRDRIIAIAAAFLELMPEGPQLATLEAIEAHLDETWFSWIGGIGDDDSFYYRLQSPVIMLEFDHHAGVWLTNTAPMKCHIHTLIRTPNGDDYGKDLLRQHYADSHPGHAPGGRRID